MAAAISVMEAQVLAEVADARSESIKVLTRAPLETLVLLNAWHPDVARWGACYAALSEPLVIGKYTVPAIELLGIAVRRDPAKRRTAASRAA